MTVAESGDHIAIPYTRAGSRHQPGTSHGTRTMPGDVVILPHAGLHDDPHRYEHAEGEAIARVCAWLEATIAGMRAIWGPRPDAEAPPVTVDLHTRVERLTRVLLHRTFNHQSRGRQEPILPGVRRRLEASVASGRPITLFLLYNGGYRAAPFPDRHGLVFHPDQTELLLLHQISMLQRMVAEVHEPGIDFVIVVNNGVASRVNDIPIVRTEAYAARLRDMIRAVDAGRGIRLLVQSEMPGFDPHASLHDHPRVGRPTPREHAIIERFLGRRCDEEEARTRLARYATAEAEWAEDLRPLVESQAAILLRQVAHPAMLSFRPFPGGAIRAQNGTLGFRLHGDALIPRLVTSETFAHHRIRLATVAEPLVTGVAPSSASERDGA